VTPADVCDAIVFCNTIAWGSPNNGTRRCVTSLRRLRISASQP
jgi:hypothetical protein